MSQLASPATAGAGMAAPELSQSRSSARVSRAASLASPSLASQPFAFLSQPAPSPSASLQVRLAATPVASGMAGSEAVPPPSARSTRSAATALPPPPAAAQPFTAASPAVSARRLASPGLASLPPASQGATPGLSVCRRSRVASPAGPAASSSSSSDGDVEATQLARGGPAAEEPEEDEDLLARVSPFLSAEEQDAIVAAAEEEEASGSSISSGAGTSWRESDLTPAHRMALVPLLLKLRADLIATVTKKVTVGRAWDAANRAPPALKGGDVTRAATLPPIEVHSPAVPYAVFRSFVGALPVRRVGGAGGSGAAGSSSDEEEDEEPAPKRRKLSVGGAATASSAPPSLDPASHATVIARAEVAALRSRALARKRAGLGPASATSSTSSSSKAAKAAGGDAAIDDPALVGLSGFGRWLAARREGGVQAFTEDGESGQRAAVAEWLALAAQERARYEELATAAVAAAAKEAQGSELRALEDAAGASLREARSGKLDVAVKVPTPADPVALPAYLYHIAQGKAVPELGGSRRTIVSPIAVISRSYGSELLKRSGGSGGAASAATSAALGRHAPHIRAALASLPALSGGAKPTVPGGTTTASSTAASGGAGGNGEDDDDDGGAAAAAAAGVKRKRPAGMKAHPAPSSVAVRDLVRCSDLRRVLPGLDLRVRIGSFSSTACQFIVLAELAGPGAAIHVSFSPLDAPKAGGRGAALPPSPVAVPNPTGSPPLESLNTMGIVTLRVVYAVRSVPRSLLEDEEAAIKSHKESAYTDSSYQAWKAGAAGATAAVPKPAKATAGSSKRGGAAAAAPAAKAPPARSTSRAASGSGKGKASDAAAAAASQAAAAAAAAKKAAEEAAAASRKQRAAARTAARGRRLARASGSEDSDADGSSSSSSDAPPPPSSRRSVKRRSATAAAVAASSSEGEAELDFDDVSFKPRAPAAAAVVEDSAKSPGATAVTPAAPPALPAASSGVASRTSTRVPASETKAVSRTPGAAKTEATRSASSGKRGAAAPTPAASSSVTKTPAALSGVSKRVISASAAAATASATASAPAPAAAAPAPAFPTPRRRLVLAPPQEAGTTSVSSSTSSQFACSIEL